MRITNLVNKVPTRSGDQLLLKVDSEEDEERAKSVRKRALKVLKQIIQVVQYVEPEKQAAI